MPSEPSQDIVDELKRASSSESTGGHAEAAFRQYQQDNLNRAKAALTQAVAVEPEQGFSEGDLVSMYDDYHDTSFKDRARATLNDKHK
jgi:hypothetical protein